MFSNSKEHADPPPPRRKTELRSEVIFADLCFFASFSLARLIVWRALHRQRKERAARLKMLKLVKKTGSEMALETGGEPQC